MRLRQVFTDSTYAFRLRKSMIAEVSSITSQLRISSSKYSSKHASVYRSYRAPLRWRKGSSSRNSRHPVSAGSVILKGILEPSLSLDLGARFTLVAQRSEHTVCCMSRKTSIMIPAIPTRQTADNTSKSSASSDLLKQTTCRKHTRGLITKMCPSSCLVLRSASSLGRPVPSDLDDAPLR